MNLGSAVERTILDKQSVSSNPPVSAFMLFFSATAVLLLYDCTHMVGSWFVGWWMGFSAVYCCALLLLYYVLLYYSCSTGGWVDWFVGVSMDSWVVVFFPRYTGPALA